MACIVCMHIVGGLILHVLACFHHRGDPVEHVRDCCIAVKGPKSQNSVF